jgi:hypothetical protein
MDSQVPTSELENTVTVTERIADVVEPTKDTISITAEAQRREGNAGSASTARNT